MQSYTVLKHNKVRGEHHLSTTHLNGSLGPKLNGTSLSRPSNTSKYVRLSAEYQTKVRPTASTLPIVESGWYWALLQIFIQILSWTSVHHKTALVGRDLKRSSGPTFCGKGVMVRSTAPLMWMINSIHLKWTAVLKSMYQYVLSLHYVSVNTWLRKCHNVILVFQNNTQASACILERVV